ncbi:MAG TPA: amino acid ABC transporter substrate-binding protein [Trueperaceae bacterium]|nr:amino acid ABC transporter substrate-binding protein [Trueperaceae bacterium]
MRKLTATLTFVILGLVLGGLAFAQSEVKVGVSVALTGNFANLGKLELDGLQLWADHVNQNGGIDVGGKKLPVKLIYLDDQSDTTTSTRLTQRLITQDKVDFLVGPYSSGITQATTAIAERYKIITIAPLANAPDLYKRGFKYLFGVLPLATQYLQGVLDLVHGFSPTPKTVAILTPDNIFSLAAAEGAQAYAKQIGMDVVFFKKYPPTAQDFTAVLSQIKSLDPDVVLGTGYLNDSIQIVKQMAQSGFSPKALGFTIATSVPDFAKSLGSTANGIIGGEWWEPTYQSSDPVFGSNADFVKAYQAKYGSTPPYYAAAGAEAGVLLQMGIEKAGSLDSDQVRQALLSLDASTLFGPVNYDANGVNTHAAPAASQIMDGRATPVFPAAAAEAEAVYPKPAF